MNINEWMGYGIKETLNTKLQTKQRHVNGILIKRKFIHHVLVQLSVTHKEKFDQIKILKREIFRTEKPIIFYFFSSCTKHSCRVGW